MAVLKLLAESAGTVWKVCRQPGDPIEADEPVVGLESMKMEIPIAGDNPGVVRFTAVAEGELIPEGTRVAEIET